MISIPKTNEMLWYTRVDFITNLLIIQSRKYRTKISQLKPPKSAG